MTKPLLNTTLHTHLFSLAQTLAGFSASDVTGYSPELVRRSAEAMVRQGQIVRATVAPRRVRYFASSDQVRAYTEARNKPTRPGVTIGARTKPSWRHDEPGLVTSRTKITIAPPLPRNVLRTNTYSMF
jgi:hypothetical protein